MMIKIKKMIIIKNMSIINKKTIQKNQMIFIVLNKAKNHKSQNKLKKILTKITILIKLKLNLMIE